MLAAAHRINMGILLTNRKLPSTDSESAPKGISKGSTCSKALKKNAPEMSRKFIHTRSFVHYVGHFIYSFRSICYFEI